MSAQGPLNDNSSPAHGPLAPRGTLLTAEVGDVANRARSEATFRGFMEAAPDAVVILGGEGRIVLVNSRTERLFGYGRAEMVGQAVDMLLPERFRGGHPARGDGYFADPKARLLGGGPELHGLRKDGTEFPIEISLSPVATEEGPLVSSAIRDITERRRAEEARFQLAAIVDSSDDAIVGKSLTGAITSWNGGAERLFGYRAEEAIGQHISVLLTPGQIGEEPAIVERLMKGQRGLSFDAVRRRKDGRDIDLSVTISPIHDSRDKLIGSSEVARDITERKRAESALASAKEAAEVAVRELESFSYSVAHDLRAPLRGIDGFSQILLDDYSAKLDANGQRYLRRVSESAHHMAELIESLLALARVTQADTRHEPVDLSELVRASAERLRVAQPDRQVDLLIASGLTSAGDNRLLGVVFDNLLSNAWKFTRDRPNARVEFGRVDQGSRDVYFVRDNGVGFDMAFSSKLFGVFQRLHAATEFEGTGIGLATVQRIIRRHGGQVWAEGTMGEGACFYFTLNETGDRR